MPPTSSSASTAEDPNPDPLPASSAEVSQSQQNGIEEPATSAAVVKNPKKGGRYTTSHSAAADPVIAPGFGTLKDLKRLARDLSVGNPTPLPVEAVLAIMESRGRGIRSSRSGTSSGETNADASAGGKSSMAWMDFMSSEGVAPATTTTTTTQESTSKRERGKESAKVTAASSSQSRVYNLPQPIASASSKKKSKGNATVGGVLLQTGTLDVSIVGRSKTSKAQMIEEAHCLTCPTRILLPKIQIRSVHTAGHSCHSIAISVQGECFGWGRNENQQLGSSSSPNHGSSSPLPSNVYQPTLLDVPGPVHSAATGKSHTILLLTDGTLCAAGSNKLGQCGIKSNMENVANFRKCVFVNDDDDNSIVQVACGEEFSVAICDEGFLYTTGASQYGQLGNGETGEHFITANKIAFANCNVWTKRTTFCHAPTEKLHSTSDTSAKVIPLAEDIRIQQIACGKHHTLALEADSDGCLPRVFSFGCGDFGCLGHGVQADEYFPRLIGTLSHLRLPLQGPTQMAVSAGQHCSLFKTANGHVYYWGKHRSVGEATMRPSLVDVLANNQHVVLRVAAGGQTVFCSTANGQTVTWGQGPYGELGLGTDKMSSAKPTFVPSLDGCHVLALSCGYGHTLFVVRDEDSDDKKAIQELPEVESSVFENLEKNNSSSSARPAATKTARKK